MRFRIKFLAEILYGMTVERVFLLKFLRNEISTLKPSFHPSDSATRNLMMLPKCWRKQHTARLRSDEIPYKISFWNFYGMKSPHWNRHSTQAIARQEIWWCYQNVEWNNIQQVSVVMRFRIKFLSEIFTEWQLSIFKSSNSQIHKFTNSQIHKFTNHQITKSPNSRITKSTNHQIHKSTNSQIHKFTNHQIHKSKTHIW